MKFAYEKETYERWMSLYPLMEAGIVKYITFEEYKNKIKENANIKRHNYLLSDEKIIDDGMKIMRIYEKNQQKEGEKVGNI